MALVPHGGGGGAMALQLSPLTTTNYIAWATKAEAILDAQGRWSAVAPAEGKEVDAGKSKTSRVAMLGALPKNLLMQVATKTTAKEVWDSLEVRFVGADRVRAARLGTLRGELDRLWMDNGEELDDYAGKVSGMARYAMLGSTIDDSAMVKKLLDTVPDGLYAAVAGIEQFCNVEEMVFEEVLGRLKAFEERTRRRVRAGGERADGQLMMTAAQWAARERRQGGRGFGDHDNDGTASTSSGYRGKRRGHCYKCGEHAHIRRECPQLRKGPAAEQALLADANVDDDGLLC
ncbi:uncharacterized protein [Aegilops tauschii subsp. strangulata]|uniref:uncharacterized protein n=1 Tax=Aegilops tauschii subsp. strangulata TaxID=200361 RepID=UPI003CC8C4AD